MIMYDPLKIVVFVFKMMHKIISYCLLHNPQKYTIRNISVSYQAWVNVSSIYGPLPTYPADFFFLSLLNKLSKTNIGVAQDSNYVSMPKTLTKPLCCLVTGDTPVMTLC